MEIILDGIKYRVIDNSIEELIIEQWISPVEVALYDRAKGTYGSYERAGHWRLLRRRGPEHLRDRILAARTETDNGTAK